MFMLYYVFIICSMPANAFLLTHKCGNNFIIDLLNKGKNKTPNYIELWQKNPVFLNYNNELFYNIRCANFAKSETEKLFEILGKENINYFVFTRHPASFFRSATSYHLRGNEVWCRESKQPHFEDKTLYETLHDCKNFGEQLVISMKHFGIAKQFIKSWTNNLKYLRDKTANVYQIKCENIWQDENELRELHDKISHNGFFINFNRLLEVSPINREKLKKHSTGEFKKDFFADYDDFAKDFYNDSFKKYEKELQY